MPSLRHLRFDIYDRLFQIGMVWRIVYGCLRIVLGLSLVRAIGMPLSDLFYRLMQYEIAEEPHDFLFLTVGSFLRHHSYTVTYFLVSYLIFWGVVDVVLSISLLREELWAFPVSMYLIGAFIIYEVYRVFHTHSLILCGIIVVDTALIALIRMEYRRQLRKKFPIATDPHS